MSFHPIEKVEKGSISALSKVHGADTIPHRSVRRTVGYLPANDKDRKKWELLGVKWLEPLGKNPFLARALFPEGWKTEEVPSADNTITIIDKTGQKQAEMCITATFYGQAAKKLLEQAEKEKQVAIPAKLQPINAECVESAPVANSEQIVPSQPPKSSISLSGNSSRGGLNDPSAPSPKVPAGIAEKREGKCSPPKRERKKICFIEVINS